MEINKLDNPAWYSLSETHNDFAVEYDNIKFYNPDHCPFGGALHNNGTESGIAAYAFLTEQFFVIGDRPGISDKLKIKSELICNQMVLDKRIAIDIVESIIELDTEYLRDDLLKLVNLVQLATSKIRPLTWGVIMGFTKMIG